jgi:hypothetical protein
LLSIDKHNATLLYDLNSHEVDEKMLEPFLKKTQETLIKSELSSIILAQVSHGESVLMKALSHKKLKSLKVFWNFIDRNLNDDEKRKFLLMENDWDSYTALQLSPLWNDPDRFLFITEVYEKSFTPAEIQKIFMKIKRNSFIENMIR